jgi:predicted DnaQ family exonuclease/DinG family helicase
MLSFNDSPTLPFQDVCVSLDLETTGFDTHKDHIIEIGAVKFKGNADLGTYHSFVNPYRTLSSFITQFTGITQAEVDEAPSFGLVAKELETFIGECPVIGHNISFDLGFLAAAGLNLSNPSYDTLDMASVFLPSARGYSQIALIRMFKLEHERAHRALADAQACRRLYMTLVEHASQLNPEILGAIYSAADRSSWSLKPLLRQIQLMASDHYPEGASSLGLNAIDEEALMSRIGKYRPLRQSPIRKSINEEEVASLLEKDGHLSKAFPGYEYRPQQVEMARAIAKAFNGSHHLLVEAGTGVGKSVAYLVPAMLYAAQNQCRVVVATSTINLQQQLCVKDLPDLCAVLNIEDGGKYPGKDLRYAYLKGKGNYLCYRRWSNQMQSVNISVDEAKMLSKSLIWMQNTTTGDREELNIPSREAHLWTRVSANGSGGCDVGRQEICFWRLAKGKAEEAHILVVNHALLLADLAVGGGLIPTYDHIIIDEAHHLEGEASRQFGYQISPNQIDSFLEHFGAILRDLRGSARSDLLPSTVFDQIEVIAKSMESILARLHDIWGRLASGLSRFVTNHRGEQDSRNLQHRMTQGSRAQPDWSVLEVIWESWEEIVSESIRQCEKLQIAIAPLEQPFLVNISLELAGWCEEVEGVRGQLREYMVQPGSDIVYWMSMDSLQAIPTLNAAPINVGTLLNDRLLAQKESVVLTSATLSIGKSFDYQRERIGLSDGEEMLLGSPFDYRNAALLLIPNDMPEPSSKEYQGMLEEAFVKVAIASKGGVLGLFTSHRSLQTVREGIKARLKLENIQVLGQGVDGGPMQILDSAAENPNTVLLGTSSLWEGIDMPKGLLKSIVIARLPFPVPNDPLFAARSEQYDDPFNQYAVPQAVLRFRQGFGRLIRRGTDRGVVVVLDSRTITRNYGKKFLSSIPSCASRDVSVGGLSDEIENWFKSS